MKYKIIAIIIAFTLIILQQGDIYARQPSINILRPLAVLESRRGPVELSEKDLIDGMPDQTAREILRTIGRDPYLGNVYEAALYFLRNGTKGVDRVLKKALGRSGRYQEEFLGELVEARAVEMNVRYSKVLKLSVERYGPEMDFILEVDKTRYPDRPTATSELEDGIYVGESKTQDRSDNLEAVIEITLEDKVKKYTLNVNRMGKAGVVVNGVIFAIGGDITEANDIKQFHMEEMERGQIEERQGLTLYLALIPDEVVKRGRDNLTPYEQDFAEKLITELKETGRIVPENEAEFERILKQAVLQSGIGGVRFIISDALKNAGAHMLSIRKQKPEHWLKVFESLDALNPAPAAVSVGSQVVREVESSI